jgi:DNA-binding FadR family transcriptional regulator
MADNRTLLTIASQLRSRINGFLRAANGSLAADELVAHARSHEALVDALASGDPARAEAAMADHVEIAAERINAVSHSADPGAQAGAQAV